MNITQKLKIAKAATDKVFVVKAWKVVMEEYVRLGDFDSAYDAALRAEHALADLRQDDYGVCHARALDRVAEHAWIVGIQIPDWFGNGAYKNLEVL